MQFKFLISVLFAIFFLSQCKPSTQPLSDQDKRLVQGIEEENHKIHSFLMQSDAGMPDMKGIKDSVITLESSPHSYTSGIAKELKELLQKIERKDKESDFQAYSDFSVKLFPLVRSSDIPDVYKFYCPMTKKFWIARTKPVQNPYSPEMRTCGDLIIE